MRKRRRSTHHARRASLSRTSLSSFRRTPFATYTGDPYWNLSNAAFGFPPASPLAAFVLACALGHAPTTPHSFIPYIAGPSFFTTAVKQGVGSLGGGGGGVAPHRAHHHPFHPRDRPRARAAVPPLAPSLRLLPQPLFIDGNAVAGEAPYTRHSNDYSWKE